MSVLVQDYKNWRKSRKELKKAVADLYQSYEPITTEVDLNGWLGCLGARRVLVEMLKGLEGPDFDKMYDTMIGLWRQEYPTPFCFFKLKHPTNNVLMPEYLTVKEDLRCINNHENGHIDEKHCAECPRFAGLVAYQSLCGLVDDLQQKEQEAKRKLISRFRLSKTK